MFTGTVTRLVVAWSSADRTVIQVVIAFDASEAGIASALAVFGT